MNVDLRGVRVCLEDSCIVFGLPTSAPRFFGRPQETRPPCAEKPFGTGRRVGNRRGGHGGHWLEKKNGSFLKKAEKQASQGSECGGGGEQQRVDAPTQPALIEALKSRQLYCVCVNFSLISPALFSFSFCIVFKAGILCLRQARSQKGTRLLQNSSLAFQNCQKKLAFGHWPSWADGKGSP